MKVKVAEEETTWMTTTTSFNRQMDQLKVFLLLRLQDLLTMEAHLVQASTISINPVKQWPNHQEVPLTGKIANQQDVKTSLKHSPIKVQHQELMKTKTASIGKSPTLQFHVPNTSQEHSTAPKTKKQSEIKGPLEIILKKKVTRKIILRFHQDLEAI